MVLRWPLVRNSLASGATAGSEKILLAKLLCDGPPQPNTAVGTNELDTTMVIAKNTRIEVLWIVTVSLSGKDKDNVDQEHPVMATAGAQLYCKIPIYPGYHLSP